MSATLPPSGPSERPGGLLNDEQVRAQLREIASGLNQDADRVCAAFTKGGPLADLLRAMLGGRPKPKRGRGAPRKAEGWDTYHDLSIALAAKGDRSREEVIAEYAAAHGLDEKAAGSRYDRGKKRDVFG